MLGEVVVHLTIGIPAVLSAHEFELTVTYVEMYGATILSWPLGPGIAALSYQH
jgi:hypothetical protein